MDIAAIIAAIIADSAVAFAQRRRGRFSCLGDPNPTRSRPGSLRAQCDGVPARRRPEIQPLGLRLSLCPKPSGRSLEIPHQSFRPIITGVRI
jgi:hypothetical protein